MGGKRSGSTSTDSASPVSGWVNFQSEASWWPKEFRRQFHWNFSWKIGRQVIVGLSLLQDRAFLDLFLCSLCHTFQLETLKIYIYVFHSIPFIWIFHEMRLWILRKSACFVVLLRCVSMLDQPDVKRAAGHDLRLLPSSLVCLPLFFTSSQFSDGWRDPMLPPSPISKLIQSSLATLLHLYFYQNLSRQFIASCPKSPSPHFRWSGLIWLMLRPWGARRLKYPPICQTTTKELPKLG